MPAVVEPPEIIEEVPALLEGWVPDDAVIFAFAEREDDDRWSVVIPGFAVVGVGDTLNAAGREAIELLDDYFRMCAAEGRTFEQSRRRIPARWLTKLVLGQAAESVRHRIRHNAIRGRVLRVSARGVLSF